MSKFLLISLAVLVHVSIARATLICGAYELNPQTQSLSYDEGVGAYYHRVQTTAFVGEVDSRCGQLPSLKSLDFEITPEHTWGQYILQIFQNSSGQWQANFHRCDYDGDWSNFEDQIMSCQSK